jgi:hypothetical protein
MTLAGRSPAMATIWLVTPGVSRLHTVLWSASRITRIRSRTPSPVCSVISAESASIALGSPVVRHISAPVAVDSAIVCWPVPDGRPSAGTNSRPAGSATWRYPTGSASGRCHRIVPLPRSYAMTTEAPYT